MTSIITNRDTIAGLIVRAEACEATGAVHLLRAVRSGLVNVLLTVPGASASSVKGFIRQTGRKPAIILIGDDSGGPGLGPDGWPIARRALDWANAVMIHAAAAEDAHYAAAVNQARAGRRVLIIETGTDRLPEWLEFVAASRKPTLTIIPRGGVHPVAPRTETYH